MVISQAGVVVTTVSDGELDGTTLGAVVSRSPTQAVRSKPTAAGTRAT